jgi:hypothetical protein
MAPTQERVRFVTFDHIVSCADTRTPRRPSAPHRSTMSGGRSGRSPGSAPVLDRLFEIAMSDQPQHADADCAEMDGVSGGVLG